MSKINDVAHYVQPAASKFDQWACKSEASEEYEQMTLKAFQTAPQWLPERKISARRTPLSESSELKWKSSICIRVKQICTDPTTSSLHEVARLMESLHWLIVEIQRQHSPEQHSFAVNEVRQYSRAKHVAGNDHSEKATKSRNRPRSDHGLNSSVFHWELYFEHRLRPRVQVVSGEQQNWGHVLRSHANHGPGGKQAVRKSCSEPTSMPTAR